MAANIENVSAYRPASVLKWLRVSTFWAEEPCRSDKICVGYSGAASGVTEFSIL
jgi:hypothetical protein